MKSSYFRKLSALALSLAICMSFMPFVSATAYAADGDWYLISQYTDNTYYIYLDEGADSANIDVRDYFIIDADETSDDPMTYDSFSYQWEQYYEDDGYVDMGETEPTFTANAGSYRCVFTNLDNEEDYGIAYFEVLSGEEEVEYDGYWYLEDEGEYGITCGKDATSVTLDAESKIIIEYDSEESQNRLTLDDFAYQWYRYVEDEGYEPIDGETGPSMNVGTKYGDYKCEITNTRNEYDSRNAYFYVYEYKAVVTAAEFTSSGSREIKEYTNGYFTRDGKYDANENFIPESDYYFYYSGDDEYNDVSFRVGDKITVKYDDNTTDVYTYQEKKIYDEEDDSYWTRRGFYNSEDSRLYAYVSVDGSNQTYAKRLGVGSKVDAKIYLEEYYSDAEDGYINQEITVKDFAQIVKNPGAAWVDGAFYRLNDYEKGADLEGFYKEKVTEFKIPARVAMGDGKEYPVRRLSSWIWYGSDPLKTLTVPSSVHSVGDFAFGLSEKYDETAQKWITEPVKDFKLYASTGSAAYEYAKEFGINVIDNNTATNGTDLAAAKAEAEAKAKEAEAAKADAAAKAAEAEAAKGDSGAKAQEAAAAKAQAEAKEKEAEAAKNEVAKLKAQLKKVSSFKATAKKKGKAQLSWKKTTGVTGYQIYRSTKKTSGFKKVATIKKNTTKKWSDKKLKKGKKYYYKIRTYTVVNGKNAYGQWSEVKMIKGKK